MRKAWKYRAAALCLAVTALLGCGGMGVVGAAPETNDTPGEPIAAEPLTETEVPMYASAEERLADMMTAAEDDKTVLLYDPQTAQIALKQKADGAVFFSSPWDTGNSAASDATMARMWSPLTLTYYDRELNEHTACTFSDAALYGQITSYKTDNGVTADLVLGQSAESQLLPKVLSASRFTELLDQLEEQPRAQVKYYYRRYDLDKLEEGNPKRQELLSAYPAIKEEPIYEIREDISARIQRNLIGYFAQTTYTFAQYQEDYRRLTGQELEEEKTAVFHIRLIYTLADGELTVTVPCSRIRYDEEEYTLGQITLLEYFGAAGGDDTGYLLIPDGSGTKMNFGGVQNTGGRLSGRFYGPDTSLSYDPAEWNGEAFRLPVFGMVKNGSAFFTTVEQGAEMGTLCTVTADGETGLHFAGVTFDYRTADTFSSSEINAATTNVAYWSQTSAAAYTGDLTERICLLSGENASYSGMAEIYRRRLQAEGTLTALADSELPLYVEFLGAVEVDDRFLCFPVRKSVAMTSYADAVAIAGELREAGVSALNLRYTGWANGGLAYTVFNRAGLLSSLGGKRDFLRLVEYTRDNGIGLFPDIDVSFVRYESWFDGFSLNRDTVKHMDDSYALWYETDLGYNAAATSRPIKVIKPNRMQAFLTRFLKSYPFSSSGLSLSTLGYDLHSDYHRRAAVDRGSSLTILRQMLAQAGERYELMTEGGNAYVYPYIRHILRLPSNSSNYLFTSTGVPFVQMVLHGSVHYTGEAINLSAYPEQSVLRAIENGESLLFTLVAQHSEALLESDRIDCFSVEYADWEERLLAFYSQAKAIAAQTAGSCIRRHEYVEKDVARVEYDNGVVVAVNYTDRTVTVDGTEVPAESAQICQ